MSISSTSASVHEAVAVLRDQLVADRRHFHRHPELGFQERATAAYVSDAWPRSASSTGRALPRRAWLA